MKFKPTFILALIAVTIFSCQSPKTPTPPLVDGNLEDFKNLGVEPITLSEDVSLYFYQDDHYVWIAYDYPEDSYGTLDLKLLCPNLSDTINLHVSAQLGEWLLKEGAPQPDNALSELWWNHEGWYANEVWLNGLDRSEEEVSPNWRNGKAREMQINKARFGKGEWKLQLNIRAIQTPDGFTSITFPKEGMHSLNAF